MNNLLRPATGPRRHRYMIAPSPAASPALVESLKTDPEITVLKGDPKLLVVEMSDVHAEELKQQHQDKVTIELDAPLTPSGP